jgi:SAM-dependent methyltransferase
MPYVSNTFDVVLCGLATHHMDVRIMISEISRVLGNRGSLAIADAGGSPFWNLPGIKFFLKIAAFIYYVFQENFRRAWVEAQSVSNIRSAEEWHDLLVESGFKDIIITRLRSKLYWIPTPLLIRASKNFRGEDNEENK